MPADGAPDDAVADLDSTAPADRPVVLVVDDDRDLADTCEYWLREDFAVRIAYGGEEALDLIDDEVDVVLLDRRMPDLSGDEVLAEIDERGFECRIAMMTAVEPDTDIVEMPFDEYLVKPVDEASVRDTVEELLVRSEFDERVREYFALASTEAVLDDRAIDELGDPAALDELTARVRELRDERESEIKERERQLARIRQINGFLREIDRALVDATTRDDIAQTVCTSFEQSPYEGVWIARYNDVVDTVACEAAADSIESPLGGESGRSSSLEAGATAPSEAVRRAIDSKTTLTTPVTPAHAASVLNGSAPADAERTLVVAPIGYRETVYGALVVYVRGGVTDEEKSMLEEIAKRVGHGINAAESKQLLQGDTAIELEFDHPDTRDLLVDLSLEFETGVRLEGTALTDEGVVSCYVTVEGVDPSAVLSAVTPLDALVNARAVVEEADETLFEFRLTGASVVVTLVELGATIESLTAVDGVGTMTVRVPPKAGLRALTNAVQSSYPDISVVAKREVEDAVQSTSAFRRELEERLTARQHEVIEAALASGYFEWPRGSTAEEVADSLGIAAPTFHEHLRSGERKLIEAFFSESSGRGEGRDGDSGTDE
ncbi:bacterio-opsin activator domain-containing protein [Halobellus captivus]|uniref:bacterio-opsin activator domain-containing protein n=1 Tax=Halobellus captivus TaxID=2592614 RepID=UPI0011A96CA0|nr:bacterio-opsin activator domain-containing protein [Halobellus captivus]